MLMRAIACARQAATLLALSFPLPLLAQTASAGNSFQGTPTLKQTVNNVLVDVVVTDKNGQPVKGLTKERFQVLENGVPQQIVFFEEHAPEPASAPLSHPLQLPPNVYTDFNTVPATGPAMVLLLDSLNTPTDDQTKVRMAMLAFLKQIPAGVNIAIFTLSSRLRLLEGFNGDPAVLAAALASPSSWPKQSVLTDNPGQDTYADSMPKLGIGGSTAFSGAGDLMARFVADEQDYRMDERVRATLDAFNSLSAYLGAFPGRKNLVWFSGSFPLGLTPDLPVPQGFDPVKFQTEGLNSGRSYDEELRKTADLLQLARVAVYPVDAGGPATMSMFSVTQNNNGSLHSNSAMMNQTAREAGNEIAVHSTMDTLAGDTGGRAFYNTNDLAGVIRTVSQLGASYYSVAYVPQDTKNDGKYRKLAVKVGAPKVTLDYRRGYYADDPAKSGVDKLVHPARTASVLLRGAPEEKQILFKVRVAPTENAPPDPRGAIVRYSVNWVADLHGVALPMAGNGLRHGALALIVVAYDTDGKARNSVTNTASLILKPEEYAAYLKTGLQFHQELELPRGLVYLRVAAVDTTGNSAGVIEIPLSVRSAAAKNASAQQ
jgi:VWFA-related protein